MKFIDEKFKEATPEATVERIQEALRKVGIETYESWYDSGVENCHSVSLYAGKGMPSAHGKGITKAFARASAYGEFIERLQSGLFFYKLQSFECDPQVNLQCYAPDGKYFTAEELAQNADWMNYIISAYPGLTKEALLQQFVMYAHTDDGQILCIPFYNLFEDKYVYLPAGFIEHMYSANGCCVGNTKEEALVHAFAEIMERKASIAAVTKGEAFPEIPEEVLQTFPAVSRILAKLREAEELDVKVLDCSITEELPVICTRLINKKTQGYITDFAADPVLEIAIQRTLTEMFQGRSLTMVVDHEGTRPVLSHLDQMRVATNVLNQLEIGRGLFVADFFAEELTCNKPVSKFEDNSGLSNKQLLTKMLALYRKLEKPVLVRNYDFLGMPCYKVIVPGFSESRGMKLLETVQEYELGHLTSQVLRYPQKFTVIDYKFVFAFRKKIANTLSRENNFQFLSGIPLDQTVAKPLLNITLAYCAYKLGDQKAILENVGALCSPYVDDEDLRQYFRCLRQYFQFKADGLSEDKIFCVLDKFHSKQYVERLHNSLKTGTPFDEYLLKCDTHNCEECRYREKCHYANIRTMMEKTGAVYKQFTNGQNPENFVKD